MATFFTVLFALACVSTFACMIRERWKSLRWGSAIVAILAFMLALLTASTQTPH